MKTEMEDFVKAAERVIAGARFLDKKIPGWRRRINLETLDVSLPNRCPLHQACRSRVAQMAAFGAYVHMMKKLGLDDRKAKELGFFVPSCRRQSAKYRKLNKHWKRLVRASRAASR